jgi:hypothetical protein
MPPPLPCVACVQTYPLPLRPPYPYPLFDCEAFTDSRPVRLSCHILSRGAFLSARCVVVGVFGEARRSVGFGAPSSTSLAHHGLSVYPSPLVPACALIPVAPAAPVFPPTLSLQMCCPQRVAGHTPATRIPSTTLAFGELHLVTSNLRVPAGSRPVSSAPASTSGGAQVVVAAFSCCLLPSLMPPTGKCRGCVRGGTHSPPPPVVMCGLSRWASSVSSRCCQPPRRWRWRWRGCRGWGGLWC